MIQPLLAMPRVIGRCNKVALVWVEQVLCCWRGVVGKAVHRNFLGGLEPRLACDGRCRPGLGTQG